MRTKHTGIAHLVTEKFNSSIKHFINKKYDLALTDLVLAICRQPEYPEAYYLIGLTLLQKGDYALAADNFNKAIDQQTKQNKPDPLAYFFMGLTYEALIQYDPAWMRTKKAQHTTDLDGLPKKFEVNRHSTNSGKSGSYIFTNLGLAAISPSSTVTSSSGIRRTETHAPKFLMGEEEAAAILLSMSSDTGVSTKGKRKRTEEEHLLLSHGSCEAYGNKSAKTTLSPKPHICLTSPQKKACQTHPSF